MNERLFADLDLPAPDLNLEVGSGTHAVQTAEIMRRFEPVLDDLIPSCVMVVGDVNSTLACSLVASKKRIPVVHVEAGLRSFDRDMPEEINRVLTDQIADRLYTTERSAAEHLKREGVAEERIVFVGNLMIGVNPSNVKLRDRAARIVGELSKADPATVTAANSSSHDTARTRQTAAVGVRARAGSWPILQFSTGRSTLSMISIATGPRCASSLSCRNRTGSCLKGWSGAPRVSLA